jgi:hypothetical protein
MAKPSFVALATGRRSSTTHVHYIREANNGLFSWRPLSFPSCWRVHDLHAHCHPGARRSCGWRDRCHCHVGRGRAGLAPMATATTGKLGRLSWRPLPYQAMTSRRTPPRRSEEARLAFKIPACLRLRPTPLLAEILQRDLDALIVHALELSLELVPTLGAETGSLYDRPNGMPAVSVCGG